MTESLGVEMGPAHHAPKASIPVLTPVASSLFFNETSYLPHEIDWSYVNCQNWQTDSSVTSTLPWTTTPGTTAPDAGFWPKLENSQNGGSTPKSLDTIGDSSLFSSSLPVLFKNRLTISASNSYVANSTDTTANGVDEEVFGSLEEMESQTIGNLLPGNEDELLAGVKEEFDVLPYTGGEECEDLDLFSSSGGFELDGNAEYYPHGSAGGEHPYGEHPSRTLFVRNINSNVEDSELRALFEQYGDIRTLYTACKHRGFVMVSYYDIRAARVAMRSLQGKSLRRRKLDIHFSIPKDYPSDKDMNQGTLVVFNLDASVSNEDLRQIFGEYGEIKEIRETPHKRHHKFVEFYDVRAADAALRALNRSDIAGKRIKLEPSRPGGARRSLIQQLSQELDRHNGWSGSPPAVTRSINVSTHDDDGPFVSPSSSSYRPFSPRMQQEVSSPSSVRAEAHHPLPTRQLLNHLTEPHPHSLPEYGAQPVFKTPVTNAFRHVEGFETRNLPRTASAVGEGYAAGAGSSLQRSSSLSASLSGQLWGAGPYSQAAKSSSLIWQTGAHSFTQRSESLYSSSPFGSFGREHSLDRGYVRPDSPEVSSYGSMRTQTPIMNVAPAEHGPSSPNFGMFLPPRLIGSPLEDRRNRRLDNNNASAENKKQFQLDLDRILSGEDTRTTLMIKNIPNKYTSKMLLAAIDECHRGTYDFIYLPIDFKNKCNVGYAFINMLSASLIVPFYQTFNGKKWEKFNSEKVASLAYARIQGKAALIAHFQNSSLMNEDKRCRPIIFHSDGPNVGDQEPFPIGENVRTRNGRPEGYSFKGSEALTEEQQQQQLLLMNHLSDINISSD